MHRLALLTFVIAACGESTTTPDTTSDATSETSETGDTHDPRCIPITPADLQALVFDGQDDVSTSYSLRLSKPFGAVPAPDYLVMQFINYNERIGPLAVGTFPLDTAPNDNFGTCAECIAIWVDQPDIAQQPSKFVFQRAGSIRLDLDPRSRRLKAHIEGLELQEITLDEQTLSSVFVDGGTCAYLTAPLDFDFRWVPPEWTCDAAAYNADDGCDCGCGAVDPDCYDDNYEPVAEFRGCTDGEVCQDGACRVPCSVFAPEVSCAVGTCVFQTPVDLCTSDSRDVDPAHLGERCTRFGAGCAVAGGIMRGVCSNHDDQPTCMPLCQTRHDCAADEYCYTLYGSARVGEGKGYCLEGVSPD